MIVDERMVTYINSLDKGNTQFLNELEQEALKNHVPIIRREMQSFLKVLLQIKAPARILEVGTAVGFSTLLMCTYNPVSCKIVTIENYEKRIPIAMENFKKAGREKQIVLLPGDAQEVLKTLEEPFDFIFMDPPYNCFHEKRVLEYLAHSSLLTQDTVILVEASKETDTSYLAELGFHLDRVKEYKTNKHLFISLSDCNS